MYVVNIILRRPVIYDEGSSLSMYVVNIILGRPVIYDEGSSLSMYVVNIILGRPVIYDEGSSLSICAFATKKICSISVHKVITGCWTLIK